MLQITLPSRELFDDEKQEFITVKETTLQLEHSLISISKWEAKWHKPFLGNKNEEKTTKETIDYIKCMTINQNIPDNVYDYIPTDIFTKITQYIKDPMTATWFNEEDQKKKNNEIITSEIIYYWMIVQNIPIECQKWHIERLLTLIRVCNIKNAPPKKMKKHEMLSKRQAINEARLKKYNTKG